MLKRKAAYEKNEKLRIFLSLLSFSHRNPELPVEEGLRKTYMLSLSLCFY